MNIFNRQITKKNAISYFSKLFALLICYLVTAKIGLEFSPIGGVATPIWPPTGISMAALLVFGLDFWPAIAIGAFTINLSATGLPIPAIAIATGNTLEAVVAAYYLGKLGFHNSLDRGKDVLLLLGIAATGSTLISSLLGVTSSWFFDIIPPPAYIPAFRIWWQGDALGDLVIAPLLLVWSSKAYQNHPTVSKKLEVIPISLLLVLVTVFLFFRSETNFGPYLIFPFILWASIRFGQRGSTLAAFTISLISTWGTSLGLGPFSGRGLAENLFSLQTFIGVLSLTFLVFGALVTERLNFETTLKESESKFRRLIDADLIGTFFWRIDGKITELNNTFLNMLGYTREEFATKGLLWKTIALPEAWDRKEAVLQELQATGLTQPYEREFVRKNGTRIPILLGSALLENSTQKVVSFALDLSETKKILSDLKKAVQDREDLVTVVSHDLRNPLGSILLNASLMIKTSSNDEKGKHVRQQAERLIRTAGRMQKLIENILEVSKIEAGNLVIESHSESVQTLISESLEILRPLAEEKSIQLTAKFAFDTCNIHCDHERILQVLSNLMGNAIKFTPPHGNVKIFVERKTGFAHFTIKDTGPGISSDQLPYIFDRYWQAKKAGNLGVGLGLSIAKSIVEAHGGSIWVETPPTDGAAFHFTLPLAITEKQHGLS